MWPEYSAACIKDVAALLRKGGTLSAYRASSAFPDWIGPRKDSEAWRFEREVEKHFAVAHCVAVSSGTAALHAALVALDVRGKEVVTSPYTFSATASAILLAGGIPRFADIDPWSFCITPETVKPHVTKRTAAILPVHLFGYFQDLEGFKQFGVPVVEDACQAVGASRNIRLGNGRGEDRVFAGCQGKAGALSFNGSKNLPTGEGGALVTNDAKLAEKARRFINHGENFGLGAGPSGVGVNYRMQEVVACMARHGLRDLEARNERRRALARRFTDTIRDLTFPDAAVHIGFWSRNDVQFPVPLGRDNVLYVFPFLLAQHVNRARFIRRCAKRGLAVQAGYTLPLHHLPAFKKYAHGPLPVVDDVHDRLVLITTLTPDRKMSYADDVASIISEALK